MASSQTQQWQQALARAITDPEELCRELALDLSVLQNINPAVHQFPLRVPRGFVARMEKGNPKDPLLLQVLPMGVEMRLVEGFHNDPLGEAKLNAAPGLLHKYQGRVLLTLTGTCAVNCRYCFRRHYPYEDKVPGLSKWQSALDYIAADPSISEVILSGGDPLIVKDSSLSVLIKSLAQIPHVKRLRIHTRLPIVIPERITDAFIALLQETRLQTVLVLHSNHANEIDENVAAAIARCKGANISVLNQSVLLKNVNDSPDVLVRLSERLFEIGVIPYYLHYLDPVAGGAHFNVPKERAKQLMQAISGQLPGYLVPRLVREIPGSAAKQIMSYV